METKTTNTLYLQKLGLNPNESMLYLTLIKHENLSLSTLVQLTKIPRTTVIENIEKLKTKGLVSVTVQSKEKRFVAENPKRIKLIIEKLEEEIESQRKNIHELNQDVEKVINNLDNLKEVATRQLDIRYYKGKKEIEKLYSDILKQSLVKAYVNLDKINDNFPENHQKFLDAVANGMELWDICAHNDRAVEVLQDYIDLREKELGKKIAYYFKTFPASYELSQTDYLITQHYIAIIQSGKIPEAVVIYSDIVAKNAISTFDLLWNLLPNYE